jgi:hypothetical protein
MNAMTLNWLEVPDIIRELIQNVKEVSTDNE